MNTNEKSPIIANNFYCEFCDYKCIKNSDWVKHTSTIKHSRLISTNLDKEKNRQYNCICGKQYKHMSSLCKHKKTCLHSDVQLDININSINNNNNTILTNLVLQVIKNNNELQSQCIELQKQNQNLNNKMLDSFQQVCKNGINNTNAHNNSHNKTFNLQFFLNETCKDAMNISDFVNSIQLQLPDLETVGELGFVNGISNIIIKKLNTLDVTQRPMHCTDKKREVIYVKDENKWEKDNDNKDKLRGTIKTIAHKNSRLLKEYREKNPDYKNSSSNKCDQYNKLVIEAMGGKGDDDFNKQTKIIQQISNQIVIEKEKTII